MRKLRFVLPVLVALFIVGLFIHPAKAAGPYYWVGGNGNINDAAHWSASDGGAGGAGTPTSADDVYFTANSNIPGGGASYTVAVNAAISCKDFNADNPSAGVLTINKGASLNSISIYGILNIVSPTVLFSGSSGGGLTMKGTAGPYTITTNNVDLQMGNGSLTFNGVGGTWQLQDNLNVGSSAAAKLILTNGTLDTNGKTVTIGGGLQSAAGTKTLTLGASTINITNTTSGQAAVNITSTGQTINAGTSTINITNGGNFIGGGFSYNNVTISNIGTTGSITGANTFNNLTLNGSNVADPTVTLGSNQTITGTFTSSGYAASYRLALFSDTLHTQRTISAGVVSTSNTLFRDIVGSGAGSWNFSARTDIGNCGGNSGIVFPTGINVYAKSIPGNINWSYPDNWATVSGIPGSERIPLPQDIAIFDANSVAVPGVIITFDNSNISGINTLSATNNPQFNGTTEYFYNSLNLGTCIWNVTTATYMLGQTAQTLQGDFSSGAGNFYIDVQTGSISQAGAVTVAATKTTYLQSGVWVTNGYTVSTGIFDSFTTTYNRAIWMGNAEMTSSSLFYLTSTAATIKWKVAATNLNVDCIQSTIIMTSTGTNTGQFTGGGKTYYNLVICGSGSYTTQFNDANTFNNITIIRSNADYLNQGATGAASKTVTGNFQQTIQHLYSPLYGTTMTSIGTTDWSKASGLVTMDYLAFTGGANTSVASGGATPFLAGSHSTGSPQTGWSFTDATAPTISAAAATLTTRTTAVLNGSLDSLGSYTAEGVYIYFQYDETGAYTTPTETTPTLYTTVGTKTAGVTDLDYDTTYHFRVVCLYNGSLHLYGDDTTFLTLGAPQVYTVPATNITATGATLNGQILDFGDYTSAFGFFQYGTTTGYELGNVLPETTLTDSPLVNTFSKSIIGLSAGQTYHIRAAVRYNVNSYAYGADVTFVAGGTIILTTDAASNIQETTATLNGHLSVAIGYDSVNVYFKYGTTSGTYDRSTNPQTLTALGSFHADITGLSNNIKYYYIAVAATGDTVVNGSELYFTAGQGSNWVKVVSGNQNTNYWKLVESVPSAPTHLYTELGTGFLFGSWLVNLATAAQMPLAMVLFPWAFGWSLFLGLGAYVITMGKPGKDTAGRRPWRGSLPVMAFVSAFSMSYFVISGGGVIPGWTLIPFFIWAFATIIFRQNQEGRGW